MSTETHWNRVYTDKAVTQVSWFQLHASQSIQLIQSLKLEPDAAIIDIGAGASILADELLDLGYRHLTVLDISNMALRQSQQRLGDRAHLIDWKVADLLSVEFEPESYQVWHDRAVFHFLTQPQAQKRYIQQVKTAVQPLGYVIMATFAEDGPLKCSGLEVQRYSVAQLQQQFAEPDFRLVTSVQNMHITPNGQVQKFNYVMFQKQ
ncbi:SAM-dependent methyltransferase [Acinetobacter sp. ACNIH2]|uniref:class I SAM-dependent methyltransferase n=1 Tax=unclassified Acinetobacter TaxID=196816 RepID=UPI000CDC66FB|nr:MULTISPECIES: class I SAM-dependent methyltransferase [unclassified Acinetobacter]AUX85187.1 SAM-dependent methyltransferase [Acinetobacter sp. ACNIH2]UOG16992.1 class I SAM-dependent methyltransferase [Acinetobacter sp. PK01]